MGGTVGHAGIMLFFLNMVINVLSQFYASFDSIYRRMTEVLGEAILEAAPSVPYVGGYMAMLSSGFWGMIAVMLILFFVAYGIMTMIGAHVFGIVLALIFIGFVLAVLTNAITLNVLDWLG